MSVNVRSATCAVGCAVALAAGLAGAAKSTGRHATANAAAAPAHGRVYDASGGSGLGVSFFELDVSRGGGKLAVTHTNLSFRCTAGRDRGSVLGISTADGTAAVDRHGSFSAPLTVISDSPGQVVHDSPVRIEGQFISSTRAQGKLTFLGADGEDIGCKGSSHWTATLRPLSDHFAGSTTTGARVKFDRTVESHPQVLNFSVGGVRSRCASGRSEIKSISGGFGGRVRHNRFSASSEDADAEATAIAGRFTSRIRARGTVGLTGRDDCGYSGLHWRATLRGRGV